MTVRLVNTHDQLTAAVKAKLIPQKHALSISRREHGVMLVWSPFFKTDPTAAAWYNHKNKVFHGNGRGHDAHADAYKQAVLWVKATYGYDGSWKRNSLHDFVPLIVQDRVPLKQGPRPPAKVDDHVIEIEKPATALFVVSVTHGPAARIEMAYRVNGTIAVTATWDDFKKFFKVVK